MENYENNNPAVNGEEMNAAPAAPAQSAQPSVQPEAPAPAKQKAFETPVITIDDRFSSPQPENQPQAQPETFAPETEAPSAQTAPAQNVQPQGAPYAAQTAPQTAPQGFPYQAPPTNAAPPQRFEYTPVVRDKNKSSNKGLKIFCAVLALIVCLTGACSVGYLFGVNSVSSSGRDHSEVQLAARPDDGKEMTEAQVFDLVDQSIVGIRVYNESGSSTDCSGVVYSDDGYIISNDHIYSEVPNAKFKIYTHDGKELDAIYIAGDQISDITVLKVSGGDLKPATFGDSSDLFCGEHVVAIGRPSSASAGSSITSGVISIPKRRIKSGTTSYSSNLIQADSAINPGSSGGALVNMYGQVIGITNSKLAGSIYDSICFAIPSRTVTRVAEDLIKEGKVVSRAKLGITYSVIDSVTAEVKKSENVGLLISSVSTESDLYGKVVEGDIITHVNGKKITSDTVMLDVIENSRAGDTITVTVVSENGTQNDYTAVLLSNEGTSSYNTGVQQVNPNEGDDGSNENGPGTGDIPDSSIFNFPFGD